MEIKWEGVFNRGQTLSEKTVTEKTGPDLGGNVENVIGDRPRVKTRSVPVW